MQKTHSRISHTWAPLTRRLFVSLSQLSHIRNVPRTTRPPHNLSLSQLVPYTTIVQAKLRSIHETSHPPTRGPISKRTYPCCLHSKPLPCSLSKICIVHRHCTLVEHVEPEYMNLRGLVIMFRRAESSLLPQAGAEPGA